MTRRELSSVTAGGQKRLPPAFDAPNRTKGSGEPGVPAGDSGIERPEDGHIIRGYN